jgi:hypothetical protein
MADWIEVQHIAPHNTNAYPGNDGSSYSFVGISSPDDRLSGTSGELSTWGGAELYTPSQSSEDDTDDVLPDIDIPMTTPEGFGDMHGDYEQSCWILLKAKQRQVIIITSYKLASCMYLGILSVRHHTRFLFKSRLWYMVHNTRDLIQSILP